MENEQLDMTENKALELIENMILSAKREIHDNGFYYMLWGYLVFISALIDYFLLVQTYPNHATIWAITMPLGGVVSLIKGFKDKKSQRVITYVDEVMRHVLTAYGISLFLVCLVMPMTGKNWQSFYPVLMVIYAFSLYAMGGIVQFKPLQYGAFSIWAMAAVSFFMHYDIQLLILALGVLTGFIIPGHLMNIRFKKNV
jgi:hypothetical protein